MNKTGNKKSKVEKEDCNKLDNKVREKLKQRKKKRRVKKVRQKKNKKEKEQRNRKKRRKRDDDKENTDAKIVTRLTQAREQG